VTWNHVLREGNQVDQIADGLEFSPSYSKCLIGRCIWNPKINKNPKHSNFIYILQ